MEQLILLSCTSWHMFSLWDLSVSHNMTNWMKEIYISTLLMILISDLTGSTGSEAPVQENERSEREEEEEEKRPTPHLLLQLTLGKELARSNRWQFLISQLLPRKILTKKTDKVVTKNIFQLTHNIKRIPRHLLLQLTLGKELARSNRWQLLILAPEKFGIG